MSLIDDLKAQAAGSNAAPAAAPSVPPELTQAMLSPPSGMDAGSVLAYWQTHGKVPTAEPGPEPEAVAEPEPPPAPKKKATKGDRAKLLIACASGGLTPEQAAAYLELAGGE